MNKFGLLILLLRFDFILSRSYENYRVYKVKEKDSKTPQLQVLGVHEEFDVLSSYREIDAENVTKIVRSYLIPPEEEKYFVRALNAIRAEYNVTIQNIENQIKEEKESINEATRRSSSSSSENSILSYDDMIQFIKYLITIKNPKTGKSIARLESIGKTYEGRTMYIVKVSSDHEAKKPVFFLEAGIHAREWSAPAEAMYTLSQFVENFTAQADILSKSDIFVLPCANPDGYEYSRTTIVSLPSVTSRLRWLLRRVKKWNDSPDWMTPSSTISVCVCPLIMPLAVVKDRLWRKNRAKYGSSYGTDIMRNFDYHWAESGSSFFPDSITYHGSKPFSEIETRNIRDVVKKYKNRIKIYVSLHCYGGFVLYPWGYSTTPPPTGSHLDEVAREVVDAIKKYKGTQYQTGQSSVVLYEAAGGSDDYFYGKMDIKLAYTMELSSGGVFDFVLPMDKMNEIVKEGFEGIKVFVKRAGLEE